jgi:hypothetical protein
MVLLLPTDSAVAWSLKPDWLIVAVLPEPLNCTT